MGLLSNKKVKNGFFILLFLLPLIGFNNCSPMGGEGESGGSSSDVDSLANFRLSAEFFNNTVLPQFEASCTGCHADPRFPRTIPADRASIEFDNVREYLIQGTSATDNRLVNLLLDDSLHSPANAGSIGNLCPAGSAEGTCRIILQWWNVDNFGDPNATSPFIGADEDPSNPVTTGRLSSVSLLGNVFGYARDPNNVNDNVDVLIYVGGTFDGGGTLVDTITADDRGPGGRHAGHYFNYQLPAQYLDGQVRSFYVYSMSADANNLLASSPATGPSYELSAAAQSYFDSNIAPFMQNNCTECHGATGSTYESRFFSLAVPLNPGGTWNASNNRLIDKASGAAGHGGGSFCGNKNSGLCADLQQLWSIQFD